MGITIGGFIVMAVIILVIILVAGFAIFEMDLSKPLWMS